MRDEEDFFALTAAYLARAHHDGAVHVEMFFDPQTHTARGVSVATVLSGMRSALLAAERQRGMTFKIIPCFLRHLSAAEAMRTLEELLPLRPLIDAVGLDSSEAGHPPAKFRDVFARALDAGLPGVAHAGEEGPAAYIVEALDVLKVRRIDHGVRCEEDESLLERLAREQTPLTMCPLSNVKLGVFDAVGSHNLKRLLERGLCVTVNSDDPAYFGGYLLDNYLAVYEGISLSRAQLVQLARNSIQGSFLAPAERQRHLDSIGRYVAAAGG